MNSLSIPPVHVYFISISPSSVSLSLPSGFILLDFLSRSMHKLELNSFTWWHSPHRDCRASRCRARWGRWCPRGSSRGNRRRWSGSCVRVCVWRLVFPRGNPHSHQHPGYLCKEIHGPEVGNKSIFNKHISEEEISNDQQVRQRPRQQGIPRLSASTARGLNSRAR